MAVYNGMPYLPEAVDSILTQTFTDFECIIIDDASTDDTWEVLNAYPDKRIRILRHSMNEGLVASLNTGIAHARGRYIARMDADDISHPMRLEKQYTFLERHSEIGVLGTMIDYIDANAELVATEDWHFDLPTDPDLLQWRMLLHDPMAHPTVMMRSSLIRDHGGYSPDEAHAEDYGLWARLLQWTRFANLPDVLLRYRCHGRNISVQYQDEQRACALRIRRTLVSRFSSDVSLHVVRESGLPFPDTRPESLTWLRSTTELARLYFEAVRPAPGAQRIIRRDVGDMMFRLVRRNWRSPRFWPFLLQIFIWDPFFFRAFQAWAQRKRRVRSLRQKRLLEESAPQHRSLS
jgi:hypothetical protein